MREAVYQPTHLAGLSGQEIIPYRQFAGKILYKVSDLEKLLEDNYK